MNHQGSRLGPEKTAKIRKLLETTDMDLAAIAERMGCSRGKVSAINTQFGCRNYSGHRREWIASGGEKHSL
jgi:hypothetical protein